ncbi:ribose-5-phosphate isomerase-like [Octopus sinensis]|uniref:ribose-5-phosphate isomerase n=1 Tax=Octopus sinensis TaxID=2607531 RepID=A0A7E6EI18_9MOLL|nr:ribose-5-phosphate isomerase-like [Octopus sinensis]
MNLKVGDINDVDSVDITFDGCDECDQNLTLLKGGGGCHVQEKVVGSISKFYVVVGDSRKLVKRLGETWKKGIPVEVLKFCVDLVSRRIVKALGGTATVRYTGKAKCGPVVTDNGNYIIDWVFPCGIHLDKTWQDVEYQLLNIPGVVGTGLFIGIAHVGVFADSLGMTWDLKRPDL